MLLYRAFGWDAPEFLHMPLLRNADKSKISKRKNPTSLNWYRDEGFLPEALLNFLGLMGYSMGDDREIFSFDEFAREFDLGRLKVTGPVFDLKKLEWLNGEYIRKIPLDDFIARIAQALRRPVPRARGARPQSRADRAGADQEAEGVARPRGRLLLRLPRLPARRLLGKRTPDEARAILERTLAFAKAATTWATKPLEEAGRAAAKESGLKDGDFFMVLRIALMGRKVSPPLFESMEILGRDESLARLERARAKLG